MSRSVLTSAGLIAVALALGVGAPASAQLAPGSEFMDWMADEPYSSEPGCVSGAQIGFQRYAILTDLEVSSTSGGCRFTSHFPMKGVRSIAVVAECAGAWDESATLMQLTPVGPETPAEMVDLRDGPNGPTTRFYRCRGE